MSRKSFWWQGFPSVTSSAMLFAGRLGNFGSRYLYATREMLGKRGGKEKERRSKNERERLCVTANPLCPRKHSQATTLQTIQMYCIIHPFSMEQSLLR
ncbi:hypothetical protein WN55_05445 [Dufourea novaeangliae]|uniref:Uncharacterized protein n=1 Tax=Dufourea novaeangliae TaxID=178035 RepID=A0A154P0G6_DUFNO|nr:hypothetical protein WN55_05445 [Dufourea novaeangliae]